MPLITQLKMGAVNNLSDARCAAGFEAAYLGFCLDPEDMQFISDEQILQITEWIDGPKIVGEFSFQKSDEINKKVNDLKLELVQLNYYNPGFPYDQINAPVIQTISISVENDIQSIESKLKFLETEVNCFMLSLENNGNNGVSLLSNAGFLNDLKRMSEKYKIIIDFPFNSQNILGLVNKIKPFGINIKGGNELKPGYRDFDELIEMIELLES